MKEKLLLTLPPKQEKLTNKLSSVIEDFRTSYVAAAKAGGLKQEEGNQLFDKLLELVKHLIQHPPRFNIFHQSVVKPFDYYRFGLDFIRPLIDFAKSQILGEQQIKTIIEQLSRGENVILLANHQTEPDPQIISLLLEKNYPVFASQVIFVAGHRVIEDPLAIPLSKGCNLLCIYSKKHMSNPPEDKPKKVLHNQRTMKKMSDLLDEGGKCIYVAPSGGRDRPNAQGHVDVAPFDPTSVEMFRLIGNKAKKITHFYPLALYTYDMLPPPHSVEKELGERRIAHHTPVYLAFGKEIDMENFPDSEKLEKIEKRQVRTKYIWNLVHQDYQRILHLKKET